MTAADAIAASRLFRGVPARARAAVLDRCIPRHVDAGASLLAAGQPNRSLFIVVDGAVDVHVPGDDGPHVRLTVGECVGELSLIDGQPASADVVAVRDTVVIEVPYDAAWALIDASAQFARNLLRVLASRMRHDDVALARSSDRRRHFERLSMLDSLTGLHNRRWLDAVCPPQLERLHREGRRAALLMMDVDRFKAFNDAHGHTAGDAVLQRVARAVGEGLRPNDLVARYGGEEFVAVLTDVDEAGAHEVAERLRLAVSLGATAAGVSCTISIGIATALDGEGFESLLRRADAALFRAKQAGRNRVSA